MALIDEQNKLNQMHRNIPDAVDRMEENIINVEDSRDELQEQATAIEDALCAVAEADLTAYLNTVKLAEIQAIWPPVPLVLGPVYIVYGGDYGTIDYSSGGITDWEFRQDNLVIPPLPAPPIPVPPYYVRYVYLGTGWDGDTQIIQWVDDYAWGNDYLTKPLDLGGTYGLYESIDQLDNGLGVLNANKTATAAGEDVLSRYLP